MRQALCIVLPILYQKEDHLLPSQSQVTESPASKISDKGADGTASACWGVTATTPLPYNPGVFLLMTRFWSLRTETSPVWNCL